VAFVEVWHRAQDPAHGTVAVWLTSLVHRHAVEAARGVTARSEPEDLGASRGRLDALSESQREAVELSYFGALTYREIASRVGVTPATILARLHDALVVLGVRRRPAG
jgi:RNA polymerase sigma-70 factor (ECF subfamily)